MRKEIEGLKGYSVTEDGKVFNDVRNREVAVTDQRGYQLVMILGKFYRIHRLVAEAFIPRIEGKDIVNHIDGNKANNHYSNLEWVSVTENNRHALDKGLRRISRPVKWLVNGESFVSIVEASENTGVSKSTIIRHASEKYSDPEWVYLEPSTHRRNEVRCIETGEVFKNVNAASRFAGVHRTTITSAIEGKLLTAGGFHWEFV